MPIIYEVGKPAPDWSPMPEGSRFNAWNGAYDLFLIYNQPTWAEVEEVAKHPLELRFYHDVVTQVIWIFFKFGNAPWGDATYTWHLNTIGKDDSEIWRPPAKMDPDTHQLFSVTLIDQRGGIVRALRAVSLPPRFMDALNRAILRQSQAPFDMDAYNAAINQAYAVKTSAMMARKYNERFKSKGQV